MTFAAAVDQLGTSDLVMHQWDLARATGGDERLDPDEVHQLLVGMEPLDEILRASGHYGPASRCPPTPTSRPASSRSSAASPDPAARSLRDQPPQGPTPPMCSGVMWITWPGGGSSNGGKRTPGPR